MVNLIKVTKQIKKEKGKPDVILNYNIQTKTKEGRKINVTLCELREMVSHYQKVLKEFEAWDTQEQLQQKQTSH